MNKKSVLKAVAFCLMVGMFFISCKKNSSSTTGWAYNDPNNGGFEVTEVNEMEVGPGLVAIDGGTFVMGGTLDNVNYSWDNVPRRVTVPSFFI